MLGRCVGTVYIHRDRSVGHPAGHVGRVELSLGLRLSLPLALTERVWLEYLSLKVLLEPSVKLRCERARGLLVVTLVLLEPSEWLPILPSLKDVVDKYAAAGAIDGALFELFVVVWNFLHDIFEDAGG